MMYLQKKRREPDKTENDEGVTVIHYHSENWGEAEATSKTDLSNNWEKQKLCCL